MMEGLLLLSLAGLGEQPPEPAPSDFREPVEAEAHCAVSEVLSSRLACPCDLNGMQESQAAEEYVREVEWLRQGHSGAWLDDLCEPAATCIYENSTEDEVVYHLM
jgi:hypothetical protein